MSDSAATNHSRRAFLRLVTGLPVPLGLALSGGAFLGQILRAGSDPVRAQQLAPTPECREPDDVTPPQTEGPFYRRDTPERTSLLEPGMAGTRLLLSGYVWNTRCAPIAGALLDFWQADDAGVYDNAGYRLRGHQFADANGRYQLETIVPGLYPGRTRHIHVRVQPPGSAILTTQLYFPDEPRNARDGIFRPALLVTLADGAEAKLASFNFVLRTA